MDHSQADIRKLYLQLYGVPDYHTTTYLSLPSST